MVQDECISNAGSVQLTHVSPCVKGVYCCYLLHGCEFYSLQTHIEHYTTLNV